MATKLKTGLLAGVSSMALGMMIAAAPASAFDEVNWTWDATVTETVVKDVTITINSNPTGMVMLEDMQVMIGDVTAVSEVSGIQNVQPLGEGTAEGGQLNVNWSYDVQGNYLPDEANSGNVVDADVTFIGFGGGISGDVFGTAEATIDLGEITIQPAESLDAQIELPEVVSAATAVANNTSITSDVAVQLHEGQFAFNVSGDTDDQALLALAGIDYTNGNSHQTAAGVLTLAALRGDLVAAEISATSSVSDILNASVDSSATAVANNLVVSVEPKSDGDSLLIGDVVQFAHANVSASSTVHDVSVNNYANLGLIDGPLVSSVATAVGNNKSITVMVPAIQ